MVVRPSRRSMAVVAGLGGQRRCQRGRRGAGCWCKACGGEAKGTQWLEMAACEEVVPGRRRR
jgi:hypothetical protein